MIGISSLRKSWSCRGEVEITAPGTPSMFFVWLPLLCSLSWHLITLSIFCDTKMDTLHFKSDEQIGTGTALAAGCVGHDSAM